MLFNSLHYAIFLPLFFIIYWKTPHRFRWAMVLAASYYFYMSWSAKYIVLILFTTAVSYAAALAIPKAASQTGKKLILIAAIAASLAVLFVFKYYNFFIESAAAALSAFAIQLHPSTLKVMLPVGISFYTFQTLGYVTDVYRGSVEPEKHFGIYAAFISFFPQLVAGPIERTSNLLPQIKEERHFSYDSTAYGARLMLWGYFKKMVIADNLAVSVDKVFNNVHSTGGLAFIFAAFFFAIQIYCDFSGYSDIARGTAKLLGIELMENFRSPYFSASIKEFWSRWHISLSTWFRDYVYIPLGGNRVKKPRHYANLMTTFLVSGLWHGANWTFIAWGCIHGLLQVLENILGISSAKKENRPVWWCRVFLTFVLASAAFVFFRANSISDALYIFAHAFDGIGDIHMYIRYGILDVGFDKATFIPYCALYFIPLAVFDYFSLRHDLFECIGRQNAVIRHMYIIIMILLISAFHFYGEATFVYFQF